MSVSATSPMRPASVRFQASPRSRPPETREYINTMFRVRQAFAQSRLYDGPDGKSGLKARVKKAFQDLIDFSIRLRQGVEGRVFGWQTHDRRARDVKNLALDGIDDRNIMPSAMAEEVMDYLLDTRKFRQLDRDILDRIAARV